MQDRQLFEQILGITAPWSVERVELDLADGTLPSLSQRFLSKTGLEPSVALAPLADSSPIPSKEPA